MTSVRTRTRVGAALLPLVLLLGCSPDDPAPPPPTGQTPTATPTATSPSDATASPSPATPSAPAGTPSAPPATSSPATSAPTDREGLDSPVLRPGANTRPASGAGTARSVALLRDVRVGAHRGFDRIVLEFDGEGTPEYRVEYVDRPIRAAGSGDVVPVAGDAWLEIWTSGASGVDLTGENYRVVYTGPERIPTPQLDVVREVVRSGDFEAVMTWVAGVRTPQPFTVRALADPARLVVDIRTP